MAPGPHRPRRRFGQHFLHDREIIRRIVEALPRTGSGRVIEIGPGRGALTFPLLERLPALEVIEIDRDLARELEARTPTDGRLTVHCTDALKFDFCRGAGPVHVIGNLPYNITTPLLFHLLDQSDCLGDLVLMVQREVAERICAGPGTGDYGRLSVMVQSACSVAWLFRVGTGAFTPAPKVESAVIRLRPAERPPLHIADRKVFADLVRRTFSQRRKTLRRSLKGQLTETELEQLGIEPAARPEELPLQAFANLANHLAGRRPA